MKEPIELPPPPHPNPFEDPLALAVVREVYERGEAASEAGVIARAGVTAGAFSERYASLEDCAADTLERIVAVYERRIGTAFNSRPDWRSSIRAAAYEAADFIAEYPEVTHFGMTGVLQMKSERARLLREGVFVFCGQLIDLGRTEADRRVSVDGSAATYAIGSIMQLLTHRLQAEEEFDVHEVVPEMMYSVVRVYLGDQAAEEELSRPSDLAS
jgi:AcrR family transcriptional regulator